MRPESRRIHESWLRNHVEGTAIGARPVVKVRPSEVQSWIKGRSAALGPSALAKSVVMLRAVFSAAVADGICARNPVQPGPRLALPRSSGRSSSRSLSPGAGLGGPRTSPGAGNDHHPGSARAAESPNCGACACPTWDFLRREVSIGSQLDPAGRRAPLKTARSRRIVPLPAVAADALAAHLA
jgi:hypothetical protein